MAEQVKSSIRMIRKGKEYGYIFECPLNLTKKEKIQFAKDKYRDQMKRRAYGFTYQILI